MTQTVPTSLYIVNQLGQEVQDWMVKVILYLPKIFWGGAIMLITFVVANQIVKFAKKLLGKTKLEKTFIQIICLVIRWIVIITGSLFALNALGLNGIVASVIAGAGFTSVIIAFGTQDISKNLISGVFIIMGRQFKVGDNIIVFGGFEGIVRQISLRAITLESTDGRIISVPNSTIFTNVVTNMTSRGKRRIYIDLKLKNDIELEVIEETILQILMKQPSVFKKPTPEILVDKFDSKNLDIKVSYWSDSSPMMQRKSLSEVNYALVKLLREKSWLAE